MPHPVVNEQGSRLAHLEDGLTISTKDVKACRLTAHLFQNRMQAVAHDVTRRQRQAPRSLEQKATLPTADVISNQRGEGRVEVYIPKACIGLRVWYDPARMVKKLECIEMAQLAVSSILFKSLCRVAGGHCWPPAL